MNRPLTRLAAAVGMALLAVAWPTPTGSTQEDPEVTLDVGIPGPWFGPDVPLTVDVAVQNPNSTTFHDLRVNVAIYPRVRSRSELDLVFDGRLPRIPLETFAFRLDPLSPGETANVRVEEPLSALEAFDGAPDGLYPLSVTVRRSTDPPTIEATSAVALLHEPPVTPLRVLPVLDLAPPPLLQPDGTPAAGAPARLERLGANLEGLPVPGVPLGLALNPTLIEELDLMTDTAHAEEAEVLVAALRRTAVASELLAAPYERAYLPHLASAGTVAAGLSRGAESLSTYLDQPLVPLTIPPGLALDTASVEALGEAGVRTTLADGQVISEGPLTPADPVGVGDVVVLPTDRRLGEALSQARGHLEISRAAAQTAMVFFESPGRDRTLAVVLDWAAGDVAAALAMMRDAPWLELVGPSGAAHHDPEPATLQFPRISDPPERYRHAVRRANAIVSDLADMTYEDNTLQRRLRTAAGVAGSTATWDGAWDRGRRFAVDVAEEVEAQYRMISIGAGTVTFTSRRGDVPITVVNGAEYPIRVRVEVASPKLRFPDGSTRLIDPLDPPGETVTFPALADATGTFPLTVTLRTSDGRAVLLTEELVVRSTAANVFALALTLGAAGFLIAWYGRRMLPFRKRARRP